MTDRLPYMESTTLAAEELPLCPYCDQPLQRNDQLCIVGVGDWAGEWVALAHLSCAVHEDDEYD